MKTSIMRVVDNYSQKYKREQHGEECFISFTTSTISLCLLFRPLSLRLIRRRLVITHRTYIISFIQLFLKYLTIIIIIKLT